MINNNRGLRLVKVRSSLIFDIVFFFVKVPLVIILSIAGSSIKNIVCCKLREIRIKISFVPIVALH